MFEERKNLLVTVAKTQTGAQARSAAERAKESEFHIERIRAMLLVTDSAREQGAAK